MSEQPTEGRTGDKGAWYFRTLGLDTQLAPTTLEEVARDGGATRTSELITQMWEETGETRPVAKVDDPMSGWQPSQLSPTISSKRRVRWPLVALAIVVGAAAAFSLWWMPQVSEHRAATHADLMRNSLADLFGDLGNVQQALAIATEPASEEPDLGSVAVDLAGVADSAARLLDIAGRPVPSPLPLTSAERFDELDSFRQRLGPLAGEATSIRSDVADIVEYRLALSRILNVTGLPFTGDSATINAQGAVLATVLSESVAALATMPLDGPLAGHRALVDFEVTAFAQWQDDYLEALRSGDALLAESLVNDLSDSTLQLKSEVVAPLASLRSNIDARILDLADQLDRAIAAVP